MRCWNVKNKAINVPQKQWKTNKERKKKRKEVGIGAGTWNVAGLSKYVKLRNSGIENDHAHIISVIHVTKNNSFIIKEVLWINKKKAYNPVFKWANA